LTTTPASQVTANTARLTYDYVEKANITDGRTYDGLNRDTGIVAVSGGYDLNGNLTNEGSGGRTFTYDIDNRLLTATGGTANVTLAYDPMGRLSSYTAGALTIQFLYDGTNLVAEYQAGVMVKRYMHTVGVDQPFMEFAGTGTAAANTSFLLANSQGSIIALADSAGTVNAANVYKYGPYGEPVNGASAATWGGERFRYTGQTVMPEAQLYYYKARVYDPKYGRFLQTDPIGSKDDLNLYAYVGGDPINNSDPTGLATVYGEDGGYVKVDGNGNGRTDDEDDLNDTQKQGIGHDFAKFIKNNSGTDIGSSGKKSR
jgi:RHS repeat-associated protein